MHGRGAEASEHVDVLVVGAGPAGAAAARAAAAAGVSVLIAERKACVGLPVQCAEFVPAQIAEWVTVPPSCVAQPIDTLRTCLPDGEWAETPSRGCVLQRALFDRLLAAEACRAGAGLRTGTRAVRPVPGGVLLRQGDCESAVGCTVIVGADGPRSTVGRWSGRENRAFLAARQVEVVLRRPQPEALVWFDAAYPGGYGWLFPKGATANVGVGVKVALGGDPGRALAHLLARLGDLAGPVLGSTGGLVPAGGQVSGLRAGNVLLVGDAAGQTHPVTGAGILAAVAAGTLAGRAAARAVRARDLELLAGYEAEWAALMAPSLRRGLLKRQHLEANWSPEPAALARVVRQDWIAYPEYWRGKDER